jgi:hypothetical protein
MRALVRQKDNHRVSRVSYQELAGFDLKDSAKSLALSTTEARNRNRAGELVAPLREPE